jgi:hypothetical protein
MKDAWKKLNTTDRIRILHASGHFKSSALIEVEADCEWNRLLLSTQEALERVDWNAVLGRIVRA